tara:strand:+ start:575 stop:733 length:159 start_codon:yes stop_codon:yes gene_type:complete
MDHTNDRKPNAKPIGSKDAIPIGSDPRIKKIPFSIRNEVIIQNNIFIKIINF